MPARRHNMRMEIEEANARKHAWSSYWAGGNLHSCVGSYGGNYSGAIGEFWRDVLAKVSKHARVLDLATGNGALPLLFMEQNAEGESLEIHGVDQAVVSPPWYRIEIHRGVVFHAGVEMESLPFPDQSFDLVVSQFGLEYGRWPDALGESLRVARDMGVAAFVMHHPDSVLLGVGKLEMEHQRLLLEDGGLLDAVEKVLPWLAAARRRDGSLASAPEALHARRAYNMAIARVSELIEASPAPDLLIEVRAWTHGLLVAASDADEFQQSQVLAEYRDALHAGSLRTREMIGHAVSQSDLDQVVQALGERWPTHTIDCQVLRQEQGILGWAILAIPPDQS